jgi:hypothetical protein
VIKANLKLLIDQITEKNLNEILKIKNPNEKLFELMKMFFNILNIPMGSNSFFMFHSHYIKNFSSIKLAMEKLLNEDLKKETIDLGLPFVLNYADNKKSLLKINKHCVLILDIIKLTIDFNIKKSLIRNLYNSNINVKIIFFIIYFLEK